MIKIKKVFKLMEKSKDSNLSQQNLPNYSLKIVNFLTIKSQKF